MTRFVLRIRRDLADEMLADLVRPHPFAFERVGFLYGRTAPLANGGAVVLARQYEPVPDGDYLPDSRHGATIGSTAIRRALSHALATNDSVLHVHHHVGSSYPSGTDMHTYRELTPTYVAAAPDAAHGGLILGVDDAFCVLMAGGRHELQSAAVRIIGFPLALWETPDVQ